MSVVESREANFSTDVFVRLVAGGLAGVTAASVTYPLDLVRTRLSAQVLNLLYFPLDMFLFVYDLTFLVFLNVYPSFGLADKCKLL